MATATKRGPKVRKEGTEDKHGTATQYASYGCHCDLCRAAHNRAHKSSRAKAKQRFHDGLITIKHGSNNSYLYYGCRCDECKAAHTRSYAAMEARRKAKMSGEGGKTANTAKKSTAAKKSTTAKKSTAKKSAAA